MKFFILQEVLVFVDSPNKKLFCRLCNEIFKDPVIVSCGVSILLTSGFVQAMEFWKNYGILKRKFHIRKNYGI